MDALIANEPDRKGVTTDKQIHFNDETKNALVGTDIHQQSRDFVPRYKKNDGKA